SQHYCAIATFDLKGTSSMFRPPEHFLFLRIAEISFFFFYTFTATAGISTLSLHDALPIYGNRAAPGRVHPLLPHRLAILGRAAQDRKSTRLNSSHGSISYAVFYLKKKN